MVSRPWFSSSNYFLSRCYNSYAIYCPLAPFVSIFEYFKYTVRPSKVVPKCRFRGTRSVDTFVGDGRALEVGRRSPPPKKTVGIFFAGERVPFLPNFDWLAPGPSLLLRAKSRKACRPSTSRCQCQKSVYFKKYQN